jgi:hypothetical protein
MVRYVAGFYRTAESFDDETLRRTLSSLHALDIGFFPASMWLSREHKGTFHTPAEYSRSLVPDGYFISGSAARIPLECSNGVALTFTQSDNPRNMPANLVMEFSDHTITTNAWSLYRLLEIFKAVISSFSPDFAVLYDEAHRARPTYDERMFDYDVRRAPSGLYWLNYFSRDWVANIGKEKLRDLSKHVAREEWLSDGGVLIALQEDPYDEGNPAHREHQLFLEERVLDLPAIQARFPNPGL